MKVAALDLGTNTFLLLIAEVEGGRVIKVYHDEVRVVRLGQGVHQSRRLHPEALKRADECLAHYSSIIREHGVSKILGCATSAARDVENGRELIDLALRYEIPIEIISGEREAELTFAGTIDEGHLGPVLIIDIGGGSTEFIVGDSSGIKKRRSIDVGSVRLTEIFVSQNPVPASELSKMSLYIDEKLNAIRAEFSLPNDLTLIAVAGTPTTLATLDQGLEFESNRVHGYQIPISKVESWVGRLASMTVEQRQALAGMEPKRADVIVAGLMILNQSVKCFGVKEIEVSVRGLRYGLARSLGGR